MRILGIDPGERRIGIAVSDPLLITAQGLETFDAKSGVDFVDHVRDLVERYDVEEIVVGNPLGLSGKEGESSAKASDLARRLGESLAGPGDALGRAAVEPGSQAGSFAVSGRQRRGRQARRGHHSPELSGLPEEIRMRRAALLYIAVLVVLAAAGTMAVLRVVGARPPRKAAGAEPVLFAVRTGESFSSVARRLGETDLVAHPRVLEIYAWVRGSDRRVKAGTYALGGGETPGEILEKLVLGDIFRVSVTIPEGFMHTQIAGALAAAGIDSAVFAGLYERRGSQEDARGGGAEPRGLPFSRIRTLFPWG